MAELVADFVLRRVPEWGVHRAHPEALAADDAVLLEGSLPGRS